MSGPHNSGRMCRACLSGDLTKSVSLARNGWRELYQFCVHTEVPEEHLPEMVLCTGCAAVVKKFAKFKRKCEQSETFWRSQCEAKLDIREMPVALQEPVVDDDKPIKVEIEDISDSKNNINDESNQSEPLDNEGVAFENDCRTDYHHLGEVKTERPSSPEECEEINKTVPQVKTKKPRKQYKTRQKKNTTSGKGPFLCNECGISFSLKPRLASHIASMHGKPALCGLCEHKSQDASELKLHLQKHFANNDLKCSLCAFEGRDFADMVGHRLRHTPMGAKFEPQLCLVCGKRSGSALATEFHFRRSHQGQTEGEGQTQGGWCRTCGKRFSHLRWWKRHEFTHDEKGFRCHVPLCGNRYRTQATLEAHARAHAAAAPAAFVCDYCARLFTRNSNLKLHIQTVHRSHARAPCPHCASVFKHADYLTRHVRLRHSSCDTRYPCPRCPATFPRRTELAGHAVTHCDLRPFECGVCRRRYKRRSTLNAHLKTHLGDLPHKCPECHKAFSSAGQLRRHSAAHTGRRKHACGLCARSFHEKNQLDKHRLKVHPTDSG